MIELKTTVQPPLSLYKNYQLHNALFFDIETTGLHRRYSHLYLIGVLYLADNDWKLIQWFAEKPSDEPQILQSFLSFINNDSCLIHYNGDSFDLPYVKAKCEAYKIPGDILNTCQSIDLYRRIRPYQKHFALDHLTQKDAERFLEIHRKDSFSGKQLIQVYRDYLTSADEKLLKILLLHNYEDIYNMSHLLQLESYHRLFEGDYKIQSWEQSEQLLTVRLTTEYIIPKPISCQNEHCRLITSDNQVTITIEPHCGILKYYYNNPKEYYYLPAEDKAIHKSIGAYVDKEYRIQATAANCYQKHEGIFLPQYKELITPALKENTRDVVTYFPVNIPDIEDIRFQTKYIDHILKKLQQSI